MRDEAEVTTANRWGGTGRTAAALRAMNRKELTKWEVR